MRKKRETNMTVVCKILVYAQTKDFAEAIQQTLNKNFFIKITDLFTDALQILQRELYDIFVVECPDGNEDFLRVIDAVLLGTPVIVAVDGQQGAKENGLYSTFYFINKDAPYDEWISTIKKAIEENYIINSNEIFKGTT